jgi:hypothetical protein
VWTSSAAPLQTVIKRAHIFIGIGVAQGARIIALRAPTGISDRAASWCCWHSTLRTPSSVSLAVWTSSVAPLQTVIKRAHIFIGIGGVCDRQ